MSRSRIVVEFSDRPTYPVRIGLGLARQLGSDLRAQGLGSGSCLAVCDADSQARCLPVLRESLSAAGFGVTVVSLPTVNPEDAWACVAELHQVLGSPDAPESAPVVVCAGVQASELAAFAVATYGASHPLVLAPASLVAAMRLTAVDSIELDAGYPHPLQAPVALSYGIVDPGLLACESLAERDAGLHELKQASRFCEEEYRLWQEENLSALASFDEDACVLAFTEVLAARANVLGQEIAARVG